jgi:hypothetical protein
MRLASANWSIVRYNRKMSIRSTMRTFGDVVVRAFRLVVEASDSDSSDVDRRLSEGSRLFGAYNYRTGRMDGGSDPIGWYDEDV